MFLLDLLLQFPEQIGMEKVLNGNAQAITELFDGGNGGAVVPPADDIVHSGLGDAAHTAQTVDGNIPFPTQFQNPLFDRLANIHAHHLTSYENDTRLPLKNLTLLS